MTIKIESYKPKGTRNLIRKGDRVKFQEKPGKAVHEARVQGINVHAVTGEVDSIEIIICRQKLDGKVDSKGGMMRIVSPEKITRMSQARAKRVMGK